MAVIEYKLVTINYDKIKTVEDVVVIFKLMGWSFNVEKHQEDRQELKDGLEKGILTSVTKFFDEATAQIITKEQMLEKTQAQVKEAQAEIEANTDNPSVDNLKAV